MVSAWWMVANYLLPLPLILFVLLAIPVPKTIRRGILLFCTRVFDLPLVGIFRLLHIAFFLTGLAFFGALRQLQTVKEQHQLGVFGSPNQEIALLSKKWRTERNVWIAAFALAAWGGLAAFYREAQRRSVLEDELQSIRGQSTTGRTARAPPQPSADAAPSQPREDAVGAVGVAEPSIELVKQLETQFEEERLGEGDVSGAIPEAGSGFAKGRTEKKDD